jgi:hypothetical protein
VVREYIPDGKPSSNQDFAGQEWLYSTRDEIMACRGQGHHWPKIIKINGSKLPRGVTVRPFEPQQGVIEISERCLDGCGKERRMITRPEGELELPARWTYNNPPGYAAPKGAGVTRRQCLEESWRRNLEELQTAASSIELPAS